MVFTKRVIVEELRDIAVLIVLGLVMTALGLSCNQCEMFSRMFWIMGSFTAIMWVALWKGNAYLTDYISTKISWLAFPVKRFVIGLFSTIGYTFLIMYLVGALYERTFDIKLGYSVWFSVMITIMITLFMHGRAFLFNWRKTTLDAARHEKESVEAKYESLKNQVNPHFLFNSLNALTNLVYEDQDKAVTFIKQLSEVYRYVLDSKDKEVVPLQAELAFLQSYVFLQQIRFGEKLDINIYLSQVTSSIAPLALQMLIENAIKHNEVSEENPLHIQVYAEQEYIVVKNNLQKKTSLGETSSGIGLDNICKRYDFLSDRKVSIIQDDPYFIVKLPFLDNVAV